MGLIVTFVSVALTVLALVDIIRQPDPVIRNLHKIVWVLLVVFLPLIGITLWFILGHDWSKNDGRPVLPRRRPRAPRPTMPQWQQSAPPRKSTEEQLADLEREEAHFNRLAEEQRRARELREGGERRDDDGTDARPA